MCVCVCVCHTLSLRLAVFLPPIPEVQCLNFLDIWNPWGKLIERSGLRFEFFFAQKLCKIAAAKKVFYRIFFFICTLRLTVFLPPLPKVQCPNFLDFQNPWGKVMEISGLRF